MRMRSGFSYGFIIIAVLLAMAGCGQRKISFSRDVMPILKTNCMNCHGDNGEGLVKSGLDLEDYAHLMKGTKFGPVVVPGNSSSSTLYLVVSHRVHPEIQMPPHHVEALAKGRRPPLQTEQIMTIHKWIDQGALNN